MSKFKTTFEIDKELYQKFTAINRALDLPNSTIYEKMVTDYVREHYDDYLELMDAQLRAKELKAKISGGKK